MNRRHLATLAAAAAGILLFIYAVRTAGFDEIRDGVRRVGWGLLLILFVGGLRFVLRAECWRLCVPRSERDGVAGRARLSLRQALVAFLAGDAVGSVTPLGLLASEPTKVFLTRHHLATRESVSSLALENIVYAASVVVMAATGGIVLLTTAPLPPEWQEGLLTAVVLALGAVAIGVLLLRRGFGSALPRFALRDRLSSLRQQLHGFDAGTIGRVFALDLLNHALAVFEILITLEWLLPGRSPTVAQAIVFEALNRVVTVVFKFVPFRVGVDEALNGALAPVLTLNVAAGVTLAVIRKVRSLFWAAIGLIFVATHPARTG
jgi:hypothetical protein